MLGLARPQIVIPTLDIPPIERKKLAADLKFRDKERSWGYQLKAYSLSTDGTFNDHIVKSPFNCGMALRFLVTIKSRPIRGHTPGLNEIR